MILDTSLLEHEASLRPIRVGMVGAGATRRAIALQLATPAPGIRLAAICNRMPEHGTRAFCEDGITDWKFAETAREAKTPGALSPTALQIHYITHFRHPSHGGFVLHLRKFIPLGNIKLNHQIVSIDPGCGFLRSRMSGGPL